MVDHEAAVRTKFLALRPVMDERLSRLWAGAEADALGDGGIAIVERATGLVADDDSRGPRRIARRRERRGRGAGPTRRRWPAADRRDHAGDRRGAGVAGRSGDARRSRIPAALDLEEHAQARDRVDGPGLRGQPAEGRAVARREWLQLAGDAEDDRRDGSSRPRRAVRVHQRSGGRCFTAAAPP